MKRRTLYLILFSILVGAIAGVFIGHNEILLWFAIGLPVLIIASFIFFHFIVPAPKRSTYKGNSSRQICPYCHKIAMSNEEKLVSVGAFSSLGCSNCGKKVGIPLWALFATWIFILLPLILIFTFPILLLSGIGGIIGASIYCWAYVRFVPLVKRDSTA